MEDTQCTFCPNEFEKCHMLRGNRPRRKKHHFHTCPEHQHVPAIYMDALALATACMVQGISQGYQRNTRRTV